METEFPQISYNDFYGCSGGAYVSDVDNTTAYNFQPFTPVPGVGEKSVNPLFVNFLNSDFHLLPGSPCIDAGDPSSPNDPDGTIADMGAYYYNHLPTVTINAPAKITPGSNFTATIDIGGVTNLDAASYYISFNPAVLRLDDATDGTIGSITIPVDVVNQVSPGTIRIVQNIPGLSGASGSGYLVALHFVAIGTIGQSTNITLTNGILSSTLAQEIPAVWTRDLVEISVIPGDANGNGLVNAIDITKVERIIAGLDDRTPGADTNLDGNVNALDITKVERIIARLD